MYVWYTRKDNVANREFTIGHRGRDPIRLSWYNWFHLSGLLSRHGNDGTALLFERLA